MSFHAEFSQLTEEYIGALKSYLESEGEAWLEQAYEVGRKAVAEGLGVLDVASIHHAALTALTPTNLTTEARAHILKASAAFFAESLSPFEMTHRSYKEANDSLLKLNRQLEQRVRERTQELENVNRELNDFAQVVSHDLKAPLIGIESIVELILMGHRDALDADGKELLNHLVTRVTRMRNLIEGILQYSRAGRAGEERIEVNLSRLLREIVETIAPPPHIEIVIDTELPALTCEKTRIHQVFQNLLSNAVKFMDKPRGNIRVSCAQDGDFWKFSVADNGPGIDEDHHSRIFQLFAVLNQSANGEHTGIGLAVVSKIVEGCGGKVWVESKKGVGSTFLFTWPRMETRGPARDHLL